VKNSVPQASVVNPFALSVDPRDRLLLFDIADDPVYSAVELQVFDDDVHGRGMLVLLQHHDGMVDFYREPGLALERAKFSIGRGVGRWRQATIRPAQLVIADDGVQVDVALRDAEGRRIEIRIDDRDGVPRRRSTLLAPVGSGVERPYSFFLVLMRGFDLLRTSGTDPHIVIGGQERHVASFPGPAWLHRRRFGRYSAQPVIVELNPRYEGPMEATGPAEGISSLSAGEGVRSATLRFRPAFPSLSAMAVWQEAVGAWTLDVADHPALTGGSWRAVRTEKGAELGMEVTRPWQPRGLPLSLKAVTTVARVFRSWPTTYRWSAAVDLTSEPPSMRAAWERTAPVERANAYRLPRLSRRRLVGGLAVALAAVAALLARRRRRT